MKYGFIYETTNLYNGMKYIGQHKRTQDINDPDDSWYLGSGTLLCKSIENTEKELGDNWRSNYKREILCECDSAEELNEKEEYYLTLVDAAKNPEYYNITNKSFEGFPVYKGMTLPDYWRENLSKSQKERASREDYVNPSQLPGVSEKISKTLKEKFASGECKKLYGDDNPARRPEVREKMKVSIKEAMNRPEVHEKSLAKGERLRNDPEFSKKISEGRIGEKNPCYNKIWINNGEINYRVTKEEFIEIYESQGFKEGRLCKPYGKRK